MLQLVNERTKTMKIVNACRSALAASICVAAAMPSFGAKPYDAEIEYLDANATTGYTSYFDTGVLPADDVGALIRFSPKQVTTDSVLFGANSSGKTRWYFWQSRQQPQGCLFRQKYGEYVHPPRTEHGRAV